MILRYAIRWQKGKVCWNWNLFTAHMSRSRSFLVKPHVPCLPQPTFEICSNLHQLLLFPVPGELHLKVKELKYSRIFNVRQTPISTWQEEAEEPRKWSEEPTLNFRNALFWFLLHNFLFPMNLCNLRHFFRLWNSWQWQASEWKAPESVQSGVQNHRLRLNGEGVPNPTDR